MSQSLTKFSKLNLDNLMSQAASSERKRINYNFHKDSSDAINRLCISMLKMSYVRPHCHPQKWELMVALSGKIGVLIFDDSGIVIDKFILSSEDTLIFEMAPGTCHTLYSISETSSFFEVTPGPSKPIALEDFAVWSPCEHTQEVADFLNWVVGAEKGDRFQITY